MQPAGAGAGLALSLFARLGLSAPRQAPSNVMGVSGAGSVGGLQASPHRPSPLGLPRGAKSRWLWAEADGPCSRAAPCLGWGPALCPRGLAGDAGVCFGAGAGPICVICILQLEELLALSWGGGVKTPRLPPGCPMWTPSKQWERGGENSYHPPCSLPRTPFPALRPHGWPSPERLWGRWLQGR